MTDVTEAIVTEAKRLEEDTLYSAKGHFEAATRWERFNLAVGLLATVAAALAAVFTLSHNDVVVILLAVLVSISSGVITFLNPNKIAASHHRAGTEYNAIRNKARIFYEIECRSGDATDHLTAELKDMSRQRDGLSVKSPSVPRWAFENARRGIEAGEASYKVDTL